MYNQEMIDKRKQKLHLRGWTSINLNRKDKLREMKINEVLCKDDLIKEYETIGKFFFNFENKIKKKYKTSALFDL